MSIGDKIKFLRERKELTLEDVAKRIGVATQTVHKYERGIVTNVPISKLTKLCNVLECDLSYLLDTESNTEEPQPITKSEAELLEVLRRVPEDKRELVKQMALAFAEDQEPH